MVTDDRSESGLSEEFVLHNRSEERERVESTILEAIASMQYDETDRFAVRLAFEEALSNAFKHGNKGDDSKPVTVFCAVDQRHIEIEVTDQGEGFDPDAVPDPTHHART